MMSLCACPVIAVHMIQCALFTNHRMTVHMCDAPAKKVLEQGSTNRLPRHQIFRDDYNSCRKIPYHLSVKPIQSAIILREC